ncbi:Tat pathway signal sequence domain protein [Zavarzinia compransoris]|uniref:Tat pathway signal sequence domain protein n=1 Tax=Zavarzinia compransoris TaxID=1264899 RepID=A0A317EB96_9PROT|nr:Tat pathway signal sequence domain protein [Zavarzinia compransoris]
MNKLEPQAEACRAYLVLNNPAGPDITDLKLDLILFNQDQVIERRIAVGLSPLPAGKTTVKLFDIQGQDCARVGSVLINEVMACNSTEGAVPDCTKRIAPSSRVGAKLFK